MKKNHNKALLYQLVAVYITALGLRLIYLWQIHDAPFFDLVIGDAKSYDLWAQRIATGQWLGQEVFYQAPLYPYFMGVWYWVFGHSLLAVRIIQALLLTIE